MTQSISSMILARSLLSGCLLATAVAGCSNQQSDDGAMAPASVIAALEAAARGEAHPDDLHPDTVKSGKAMTPMQAAFDVQHYALTLKVLPESRSIQGSVAVRFDALESLDTVQLDLDPRLAIEGVTMGETSLNVRREEGSFMVSLPDRLAEGDSATIIVAYGGKPHVALAPPWFGGFVWSEVNGTPWFATAVQGDGCDLWWPCKDNFADKPDQGIDLAISAPKGVKVASVGVLRSVDEGDDGFDTWHWSSRHPYSGYAVAINGGPFELVEDEYEGINGSRYPIQFWALEENADKARALINSDVIPDLEFFERILGPYPWGDEKAGFVETPHLGMEHQTINGYGEQYRRGRYGYDWLLHHELAHEWFGNVMTHARPEDAWLHEGYGAYMQAVYSEETVGAMGYFDHMYGAYTNNEHCLPVANPEVEDAGEAFDNRDIYTKGSWMLHSLRRHIGEEAFWAGTRRLIYDTAEPWDLSYPIQSRYRSTEDFIDIMSDEAGEDVSWLVQTYLREAGMPELVTSRDNGQLSLSWNVPGDRDFPMPIDVSIDGEITVVDMSSGPQSLSLPDNARVIVDPESKILRTLPIIGDCSEQTEQQILDNIERFTRMAKDYGWQRD
ncbi:M1 family metallopeptidase [Congregibacter brevis]|uniref:M1 family metallopeptidase n=1 Tax=Congregibacter brevis TaxID=3081201 RepID=A0ABZ0IC15_9GAMM|nr:M1 family metallopeptidase [Congregibacter sp. IMCC45268]